GGFFNALTYKNLKLSALLTFSAGNVVRLRPAFSSSYSELDATPEEFLDRWLLYGDQSQPAIMDPRQLAQQVSGYPYNNYNYSTMRVANGDFIRLKQLMLSYDISSRMLQSLPVQRASLSLVANNLWLIYSDSKLNGQD